MNKKVLCLNLLLSKTNCLNEILEFLLESKVISPDQAKSLKLESDQSLALHLLLEQLKSQDKLQLLDYEWHILPKEYIRLLIVTEYAQRDFIYGR